MVDLSSRESYNFPVECWLASDRGARGLECGVESAQLGVTGASWLDQHLWLSCLFRDPDTLFTASLFTSLFCLPSTNETRTGGRSAWAAALYS